LCRALNSNKFTGGIPPTLGLLSNLIWLDMSANKLSGQIPVSPGLNQLVKAKHLWVLKCSTNSRITRIKNKFSNSIWLHPCNEQPLQWEPADRPNERKPFQWQHEPYTCVSCVLRLSSYFCSLMPPQYVTAFRNQWQDIWQQQLYWTNPRISWTSHITSNNVSTGSIIFGTSLAQHFEHFHNFYCIPAD
jgi:hypothetical protein